MPRFAANLTLLFTEHGLLERIGAAASAGFSGCEVLFPGGTDLGRLQAELERHTLALVLINAPSVARGGLPNAPAADPARKAEFRTSFRSSLEIAQHLQPERIHVMSGPGAGPQARACLIENLKWAADTAPDQAMTIEPINTHDVPGYFMSDYDLALDVIDQVNNPNLGLQFDTYHAASIAGDPWVIWQKVSRFVTHIQVGRAPDRHEPIGGAFDHKAFFRQLDQSGYDGWVSGEYRPAGATADGLEWIRKPY